MDAIAEHIEALIPQGLDDIIRTNRDKVQLRMATDHEIMAMHENIGPGPEKDMLDSWNLVVIEILSTGTKALKLLGTGRDGYPWITSRVIKVDLDRGYVITKSNSLYRLGVKGGEPTFEQLALLCASLHSQGMGSYLGVPNFIF